MVVEHGDGSVLQFCVGISGSSASGETVLTHSGVQYSTISYSGMGEAVCQIDHEPQSYPPGCFQSGSPYWEIFVSRAGGAWNASQTGISTLQLNSGDVLGFRYENGSAVPARLDIACPPPAVASQPASSAAPQRATSAPPAQPSNAATVALHQATASPTITVPGKTPTGAVSALHSAASAATYPAPDSGPSFGLLFAFLCGGGLIGLMVLQFVLRR